ncbi:MAG: phosphatase [Sphingobacteriaceae bacterium]|nr:phosphatase [Sphingobacteriaceae bacterium]
MSVKLRDFKGEFVIDKSQLKKKSQKIKALLFDWDGVFNNGEKQSDAGSNFSEVDSMGTNLLRFSFFLTSGKVPLSAIISGEKNNMAAFFTKRENFNYSFSKISHKIKALEFICEKEGIKPEEVAYFFDDVLDLSIASVCGVRILIDQKANPLFFNYCIKNNLADYVTHFPGGQHAIREGCELLMEMNENFNEVINLRKDYKEVYAKFIAERKKTEVVYYTSENHNIVPLA